jgi:hypothetical protein
VGATLTRRRRLEDCRRLTKPEAQMLNRVAARIRTRVEADGWVAVSEFSDVPPAVLRSPFLDLRLRLPEDDRDPIYQRGEATRRSACFTRETRDPAKQLPRAPAEEPAGS